MNAQNRQQQTISPVPMRAGVSGDSSARVGGGGITLSTSRRQSDAACRIERAKIYPRTGPKVTTLKTAFRRGVVRIHNNPWHSPRSLGSALLTDDSTGLFPNENAAEAIATRVLTNAPRQPTSETMAETIDYFLAHPDEVPQGMRAEFEADRATIETYREPEWITTFRRNFASGALPSFTKSPRITHEQSMYTTHRPADAVENIPAVQARSRDKSGLEVLNAADWMETMPPPVDMILNDMADMGTKIVLIAQSKFRKSFFLLQLAIFLAYGVRKLLAWDVPRSRRVLFVNLEITPTHFHRRTKRMMHALELSPEQIGDRLHIINGRGQSAEDILRSLPDLVARHKIDVVILDPVYKLIEGDESKQECVKALLREFDALCSKTGCALIYAHHCGKGESGDRLAIDRASGSGVLARDFDTQISLTPHLEDGLIVVEQIARSYPPRAPFCIQWDDAGFFRMRDDASPVIRTSFNRSKSGRVGKPLTDEDALDALGIKAMPGKALIESMRQKGFTARHAEATRDRMVKDGVLESYTPHTFPRRTYYGTPGMIEAMRQNEKRA